MMDPFTTLLAKESRSKLTKLRGEAQQQIYELQAQISAIDRVIADRTGDEGPVRTVNDAVRASKPGRRRGEQREAIMAILGSRPQLDIWDNGEIKDALNERGIDPTAEALRVQLRRMEESREIERAGGGWRLMSTATPNGSAPDNQGADEGYGAVSTSAATDRLM